MPESYESLSDVRALMDRALESKFGLTIQFSALGSIVNFRQRFNRARRLEREISRKMYAPSEPGYNTSVYDRLELITEEGRFRMTHRLGDPSLPRGVTEVKEIE